MEVDLPTIEINIPTQEVGGKAEKVNVSATVGPTKKIKVEIKEEGDGNKSEIKIKDVYPVNVSYGNKQFTIYFYDSKTANDAAHYFSTKGLTTKTLDNFMKLYQNKVFTNFETFEQSLRGTVGEYGMQKKQKGQEEQNKIRV